MYIHENFKTMVVEEVRPDGQPVCMSRSIEKNPQKLTRPILSPAYSGHFNFSHGHLLLNAGYEEVANVFSWEEPYQAYLAWKAGYTIYAPNEVVMWHQWVRDYKPSYEVDNIITLDRQTKINHEYGVHSKQIRRTIFGDKEFRHYYDEKFGIDLLGRQGTQRTVDVGLDPYYFFDKSNGEFKVTIKIVE